ncbi:cyclase family protein [Candidatus Falkowbacteria bacterium]|nr:cyclase family protein [Candidatus Falkowbacteria bacterium]
MSINTVDLTQTFRAAMPVYPGDPIPQLKQTAALATDGYNEFQITTGMHAGTHIDAPLHMIDGGKLISDYGPEKFFGRGHLIDAHGKTEASADLLTGHDIQPGDIVLVYFDFDQYYGDEKYFADYPELGESLANRLIELRVGIVGMDTPSPDRQPFTVHKLLLGHDILIIENLTNLKSLLGKKFTITALPAKLAAEAAPIRVVANIIN